MASTLLSSPEAVALLRRQLFELKDEMALSLSDWQTIWPFIDNMWVERNASRAKDRQQFNCRIWRNDSDKKAGDGRRNRVRRDVEPCSMKMYVIRKDDGVIISRCPGRTNDVREHNHDLGYLDKVKTPSAVMRFAADIMAHGKTPSEAVKELKALPVVQALESDGGLYIDSNRVRNAHKASLQPATNGTSTAAQKRNFLAGSASASASILEMPAQPSSSLPVQLHAHHSHHHQHHHGHHNHQQEPLTDADRGPGLQVVCQCGNVRFTTPFAKPLDVYHCHCLECQKQSASAYGTSAIYPADFLFPLPPELLDHLTLYTRATKTGGTMDCYFCKTCGVRMFHRGTAADGTPKATVSIKGGVIEGLDWSHATHIWTSRAVIPIPPGVPQWKESPEPTPEPPELAEPEGGVVEMEHEPAQEPEAIRQTHVPGLDDLAAMATASASRSAAGVMRLRHEPLDPTINPDLPAFPFG